MTIRPDFSFQPGSNSGKTEGGVARIKWPENAFDKDGRARFNPGIAANNPASDMVLHPPVVTKDYIEFRFTKPDGQPLDEEIIFNYDFQPVVAAPTPMADDADKPPTLTNIYSFKTGPSGLLLDFGYFLPDRVYGALPERSVPVHTRLFLDHELAQKLMQDLMKTYGIGQAMSKQ